MNKIQELHLNIIENNNIKCTDLNCSMTGSTMTYAEKSAEITTNVAIKFAEFIKANYEFYDDLKNDKILWNLCGTEQRYTSEQLFEEFINNHYGK